MDLLYKIANLCACQYLTVKHLFYTISFLFIFLGSFCQQTPFEKGGGKETATYSQAIDFYKRLDKSSATILMKEIGATDAGYPLHLILISNDKNFDPVTWHRQNKIVILINNGIHPGEPDGI